MIQHATRKALFGGVIFALCFCLILFARLLPLAGNISGWPGPDLGLALTLAWVLRRPEQIPAPLIVLLVLLEDVMLMRPPGLWPAIVLAGSEAARLREHRWRDHPFMVEWLRVAILMLGMVIGYRVLQILFLLPVPALGQVILQYLATVFAYPLVILAARWLVRLRRISPVEAHNMRLPG